MSPTCRHGLELLVLDVVGRSLAFGLVEKSCGIICGRDPKGEHVKALRQIRAQDAQSLSHAQLDLTARHNICQLVTVRSGQVVIDNQLDISITKTADILQLRKPCRCRQTPLVAFSLKNCEVPQIPSLTLPAPNLTEPSLDLTILVLATAGSGSPATLHLLIDAWCTCTRPLSPSNGRIWLSTI